MQRGCGVVRTFVLATLPWVIGGSTVWMVAIIVASRISIDLLSGGFASFGLVLTFSAFAGGSALSASVRTQRQLLYLVVIAAAYGSITCVDLAYVVPVAGYRAMPPDRIEQRFPFGPETPRVLAELRDYLIEHPAATPVFGSAAVFDSTPSHFEKEIQFPRVAGTLAVILALLGFSVGVCTEALRINVRHRVRWLIGLVLAFAFIGSDEIVSGYLRANPTISGPLFSWLVLALHVALLAVLAPIVRRKLHA